MHFLSLLIFQLMLTVISWCNRKLWRSIWYSERDGDHSNSQTSRCRDTITIQHDGTGDRWNQHSHFTGIFL